MDLPGKRILVVVEERFFSAGCDAEDILEAIHEDGAAGEGPFSRATLIAGLS